MKEKIKLHVQIIIYELTQFHKIESGYSKNSIMHITYQIINQEQQTLQYGFSILKKGGGEIPVILFSSHRQFELCFCLILKILFKDS
jgi:hypothetical protein